MNSSKVTLKYRDDLEPYYRTFVADDEGFVVDSFFSDAQGNPKPSAKRGTLDPALIRDEPMRPVIPVPSQAVGVDVVRRFLRPEEPCFFEGCEQLRAALAAAVASAGGEACPSCVRSDLESQYARRALEVWTSGQSAV